METLFLVVLGCFVVFMILLQNASMERFKGFGGIKKFGRVEEFGGIQIPEQYELLDSNKNPMFLNDQQLNFCYRAYDINDIRNFGFNTWTCSNMPNSQFKNVIRGAVACEEQCNANEHASERNAELCHAACVARPFQRDAELDQTALPLINY